ncbi:MAG: hypothetical protein JXA28_04550 [Bacteroidetes bacterium]|nr:hypothetical protein [Bacteroidota bacterium]
MKAFDTIRKQLREHPDEVLDLNDTQVDALSARDIEILQAEYGGSVLMHLPPRERRFMEWLKTEDPGVYEDLWGDDSNLLISLSFLQDLQEGGPGFRICELEGHSNYYFVPRHIRQEGSEALGAILAKAERGEELAVEEVLMYEIVRAPIDIWHFCYRYGVSVLRGKEAVRQLSAHNWLVHLPLREDLVPYIDE